MALVPFDSLGADTRIWVFAANPPLDEQLAEELLATVDEYLKSWTAHGKPLLAGREWRDGRFLTIGVDQEAAHASGCSIDGLYRTLAAFEAKHGVSLLSRDVVYYRGASGEVLGASRDAFTRLASAGEVDASTQVFDTSIGNLSEWRDRFELPAASSWHRALITS